MYANIGTHIPLWNLWTARMYFAQEEINCVNCIVTTCICKRLVVYSMYVHSFYQYTPVHVTVFTNSDAFLSCCSWM